jgi:hypothetical protein
MTGEVPQFVVAVERAYLLGVAVTTILLWLWLLAATSVLIRRRSAAVVGLLTALYIFLGYVGYLSLLDPITFRFVSSVAIVEPLVFHPSWVRVGVPSCSIVVWILIVQLLRRKMFAVTPDS